MPNYNKVNCHHQSQSIKQKFVNRPRAQPRCKSWGVRLGHWWCESRGRGGYCGSGGSRIFERGVEGCRSCEKLGVSPNFFWGGPDPPVVAPLQSSPRFDLQM